MLLGGQCQAPRGGEVRAFDFGNHMADGAGDDGFLDGPKRLSRLAGDDGQAQAVSARHLV